MRWNYFQPEKRKALPAGRKEEEDKEQLGNVKKMRIEEEEDHDDQQAEDVPELDSSTEINWDNEIMEHRDRIEKEIVEDEERENAK